MKIHESHKMINSPAGDKMCKNCEGVMLVQLVKVCWAR